LKIPPEPPPGGEKHQVRKAVGKRSKNKDANGGKRGRESNTRDSIDPPETGQTATQDDAAVKASEDGKTIVRTMEVARQDTAADEEIWPAPPGSIMDVQRAPSPRSVTEVIHADSTIEDERSTVAYKIRAVSIEQDAAVVVRRVEENGVLSDSGANSCMAHNE
jgi:hypothetical protein